jgi:autotransporter translocation and assembly factor TamB
VIGLGRKAEHPGAISVKGSPTLTDDYFELARFWVSAKQGRSHVLIGFQDRWDPELLGSLLVESIHTAAAGYAAARDISEDEALRRILQGFDEERARLGSESMKETK